MEHALYVSHIYWIEFTPYEIGISKYAAFMKTEGFGSKFFKARIVKRFTEFPLHYLQGIWGSAFTILFRRLLQEKTKLSIDLNALPVIDSDEEDDIFFDAEEDFQDEEEALRDALGNIDLTAGGIDDIHSENEEEEGTLEDRHKEYLKMPYFIIERKMKEFGRT
ncbi:Cytosolic phospholipase A2 [Araneus ventricosus]|uniref:Cytosolic phospholipase A2 n=3 Tax=Araneus ventricosus TaxID=182803 RepID=A0A4Y2W6C2_ARAVE|nr:Cytosolic phospholipase A2 [Araneus ventricosus]GBO32853.1 Cytosolic phospholipase A2 [Araneus ventricosus]